MICFSFFFSDDTTYDTVFATTTGNTLILRVHFPALAYGAQNAQAPEMKLTGVVATHAWLDSIGKVTGFSPITSDRAFRESRLLLGQAVKQVVQELQLHPPTISKFTDAQLANMPGNKNFTPPAQQQQQSTSSSSSMEAPPSYETLLNSPPPEPAPSTVAAAASTVELPPIPTEFPELETYDRDALEELLKDTVVFQAYCQSLPVSRELQQLVLDKNAEAAKLAQENLTHQETLQAAYERTQHLQQQLKDVVSDFQTLERQQDALCETPDPRVLLKELHIAKREAFDDSEQMAEDWLDRDDECAATMTQFCRDFVEARKVHHLRAAKMEILQRQEGGGWE